MERFDAIIAGGGVAGSATGAALAAEGLRVLICEAGHANARRLAGEFLHPPAVRDLEELGLLEPLLSAGAVPTYGIAVISDRNGGQRLKALLSYSEMHSGRATGIAMEHAKLARGMFEAVGKRANVTTWNESRVRTADFSGPMPSVEIARSDGTVKVCAPLIVSAEGRDSSIRRKAGIEAQKEDPFCMVGWKIPNGRLPYPGYGHIFIGGRTAILAYQVSRDEVRIMFELEIGGNMDVSHLLSAIPRPFRDDVEHAVRTEPRLMTRTYGMTVGRVARGRLAIAGDAGGCVHPLTASGISWCTQDAMRLAREVGPVYSGGEGVSSALSSYEEGRKGPMRARSALGPLLADVLSAQDPGTQLMREGLFRYWRRSPRGRAASIALLSTESSSSVSLVREYAAVSLHTLLSVHRGPKQPTGILSTLGSLARRNKELIGQFVKRPDG